MTIAMAAAGYVWSGFVLTAAVLVGYWARVVLRIRRARRVVSASEELRR